jgi:hypothetical protein
LNEVLFFAAKYHVGDILAECRDAQHDDRLGSLYGSVRELIDLTSALRELGINCTREFWETIEADHQLISWMRTA